MANPIVIEKSVGRGGANLPVDVVKIGGALVLIGPDRGGVFAPPLSLEGLADAIASFQRNQGLGTIDGRIDAKGGTLKRLNALLGGGAPLPGPAPARTGGLRPMAAPAGLPTSVDRTTWAPIESSLASDLVFNWTGVSGSGSIRFFELDEDVVPNWFGVVIPKGVQDTGHAMVFFHPTPGQAGYVDATYRTKVGWSGVFHYLSDPMAAQFCAASTGQIMIVPLMTSSAAETCGVFPRRWEEIVGQILGFVAAGDAEKSAPARPVSSVVVASFSSGITYSAAFRRQASLGGRLRGVIDFDGIISSFSRHSQALGAAAAFPVVRMQQQAANASVIPTLARQNLFPLPRERWGGPYTGLFAPGAAGMLQIHGTIPQTMMHVAASRTRPR